MAYPTLTAEVLADSPAVYYHLAETSGTTATDSSGNGRNGTYTNAPTLNVAPLVIDGDKAVTFDGINDHIPIAYASWMNASQITVEAWVKLSGAGIYSVWDRDSTTSAQRVFQFRVNNGKVEFINLNGIVTLTGTKTVNDNVRHHIVAVHDGFTLSLYVDGVLDVSMVNSAGIRTTGITTLMSVAVNRSSSGGSAWFNGTLDEVAYYTSALSAARVRAHYEAGVMHAARVTSAINTSAVQVPPRDYAQSVLALAPTVYYRGESTTALVDSSPNHIDAAFVGQVKSAPGLAASQAASRAIRYDGMLSYAAVAPSGSTFPSGGVTAMTVEFLFCLDRLSYEPQTFVSRTYGYTYPYMSFHVSYGGASFPKRIYAEVFLSSTYGSVAMVYSTTPIVPGKTYHVAFTYSASSVKLYVNGVLEQSVVLEATGTMSSTDGFAVGTLLDSSGVPTRNLAGVVDEISYYLQELSAGVVGAHYNAAMFPARPQVLDTAVLPTRQKHASLKDLILAESPAMYYTMSDSSGTDGTLVAAAGSNGTYTGDHLRAPGFNVESPATRFSGVAKATTASYDLREQSEYAFEFWFKTLEPTLDLVSKRIGGTTQHVFQLQAGYLNYTHYVYGKTYNQPSPKLNDGEWHQIVLHRVPTDGVTGNGGGYNLYLDGALADSVFNNTGYNVDGNTPYEIGNRGSVAAPATFAHFAHMPGPITADKVRDHYRAMHRDRPYILALQRDAPWALWELDSKFGRTEDLSGFDRDAWRGLTTGGQNSVGGTGGESGGPAEGVKVLESFQYSPGLMMTGAITNGEKAYSFEIWARIEVPWAGGGTAQLIGDGLARYGSFMTGQSQAGIAVNSSGVFQAFYRVNGTLTTLLGSAMQPGVWHHVVATFGASGVHLRVDKVEVASTATVPDPLARNMITIAEGELSQSPVGDFKVAVPAVFMKELTAAQADAHFDGMVSSTEVRESQAYLAAMVDSEPALQTSQSFLSAMVDSEPSLQVSESYLQVLVRRPITADTAGQLSLVSDVSVTNPATDVVIAGGEITLESDVTLRQKTYSDLVTDLYPYSYMPLDGSPYATVGMDPSDPGYGYTYVPGILPNEPGQAIYVAPGGYGYLGFGSFAGIFMAASFEMWVLQTPAQAANAPQPVSRVDLLWWDVHFKLSIVSGYLQLQYNSSFLTTLNVAYLGDGVPHMVTAVYVGSVIKVFVDGDLAASVTFSWGYSAGAGAFLYFGETGGGSQIGGVTIDSISLYQTELTDDVVAAHYATAMRDYRLKVKSDVALQLVSDVQEVLGPVPVRIDAATTMDLVATSIAYLPAMMDASASLVLVSDVQSVLEPDNNMMADSLPELLMPTGSTTYKDAYNDWRYFKFIPTDDMSSVLFWTDDIDMSLDIFVLPDPLDFNGVNGARTYVWYSYSYSEDQGPYVIPESYKSTSRPHYLRVSANSVEGPGKLYWTAPTVPTYDVRTTPADLGTTSYGASDPYEMAGTTSEVGAPAGSKGTAWFKWTAAADSEMTFAFELSQEMIVTAYVDTVQVSEVQSETPTFSGLAVPSGSVVEFRVTTLTGGGSVELAWAGLGEVVEPENLVQYLRVEVYEADALTKITELPNRISPQGQSQLNQPGVGEVTVPLDDPLVKAFPNMFKYRNVIKCFLGETCIYGFRIRERESTWVSTDEYAGLYKTLRGPSLEDVLNDAMVKHDRAPNEVSLETRVYDWSSPRGDWYNPADWDRRIVSSSLTDPPGSFVHSGDTIIGLTFNTERDKYGFPKDWPDKTARWMFIYTDEVKNSYFGVDNLSVDSDEWSNRYYRYPFFLEEDTLIRFHATADEWFTLHLDGEQLLKQENYEVGYTSYVYIDIVVSRGFHVIAAHVSAIPTPKVGDGTDAFLFSAMKLNKRNKVGDVLFNSGSDWEAFYGEDPPGWNRAQMLHNFIYEARLRGIPPFQSLTTGFSGDTDSEGNPWDEKVWNKAIAIGTKGTEFVATLTEGNGFDVWVDPGDYSVQASKRRGTNKSASIRLDPGRNVLDWSSVGTEDAINSYLVHYDGGWFEYQMPGSVRTYGETEAYISLGDTKSKKTARRIMAALSKGLAWARDKTGTGDQKKRKEDQPRGSLLAVHGAAPFLDFNVGDVVSAMNENGVFKPYRVLGLTFMEDEAGQLSYEPELEAEENDA